MQGGAASCWFQMVRLAGVRVPASSAGLLGCPMASLPVKAKHYTKYVFCVMFSGKCKYTVKTHVLCGFKHSYTQGQ